MPFPWHRASCRSKLDLDIASPSRAGLKVIGGPFRVEVFGALPALCASAPFFRGGAYRSGGRFRAPTNAHGLIMALLILRFKAYSLGAPIDIQHPTSAGEKVMQLEKQSAMLISPALQGLVL